jgi:hypothetical protein
MKTDILKNADEDFLKSIQYGNNILKKSNANIISSISNLEIEHVKYIMLDVLNAYLKNVLTDCDVLNFMDSVQKVLYEKYTEDFPETFYPYFQNHDERSLGINVLDYLRDIIWETMDKKKDIEPVQYLINYLKSKNPSEAHKKLDQYLLRKYPKTKSWI